MSGVLSFYLRCGSLGNGRHANNLQCSLPCRQKAPDTKRALKLKEASLVYSNFSYEKSPTEPDTKI